MTTLDDFTVTTPTISASTSPGRDTLSQNGNVAQPGARPPEEGKATGASPVVPTQDPGLVDRIASVALDIAERVGAVTADDVRATMPTAPRAKAFGAAFSKLVNEGKLLPVEYKASTVPSSHGRRIRVYHLRRIKACLGPAQPGVSA